jgi:polysaccharide deacetylase family protein (PEP-CTERM system associated)
LLLASRELDGSSRVLRLRGFMINAFTVDVEDWFHICGIDALSAPARWATLPSRVVGTTLRVLDLLDRRGIRGTFFVLGWVAERYPGLVSTIRAAGHEIGSHGHLHRRVYELTPDELDRDLAAAQAALSAAGCDTARLFRAPEWSINDRSLWALDILARRGFQVDSSMAPLRIVGNPDYPQQPYLRDTAAGPIREVPPMVRRRFGQHMPFGGGWGLRYSRPTTVVSEIARRNRAGEPVTLWIHPWELDPDPPRTRLPTHKRFAHYFRLPGFERRLGEVLKGARFDTIGAMLAQDTTRA